MLQYVGFRASDNRQALRIFNLVNFDELSDFKLLP